MKLALTALLVAAGALSACADYDPAPPPPGPPPLASAGPADSCFRTADINNHRVADGRTLYLRLANRDVFRLEMVGQCLSGVGPGDPLVIRSRGGPLSCRPVDFDISVARGGLGPGGGAVVTPCIVESMTRLTPDQVAALPDRVRP